MDPKDFFLRHGEKLAVVLVTVLGAWAIYSALVDDGIRPKGTDAEKIKGKIESIASMRNAQQAPILKPAPDHVGNLKSRFGSEFAAQTAMTNVTEHPDIGNLRKTTDGFYYIYELKSPQVSIVDQVGVIEVTVSKPPSAGNEDSRISDEPVEDWEREVKGAKVQNRAEIVGFVLEQRTGADTKPWQKVADLTLEDAAKPYLIKNVVAFEDYSFRASAVLKASGFTPGAGEGNEVLVHLGHYPKRPVSWDTLNPAQPEVLKLFASPAVGVAKVFPAEALGELLYLSQPCEPVSIQVGIDLKLALKGVAAALPGAAAAEGGEVEPPADPVGNGEDGGGEARILITKFYRQPNGAGVWVPPFLFKVKKGEKVGGEQDVTIPPEKRPIGVDFSTPFVLESIQQGRPRIIYWKIEPKARAGGGKDKDLELEKEEKPYDVVVLRNKQTQTTLELVKLGTITRPPRATLVIFPDYPVGGFKEEEEFRNNPQTFRQVGLAPAPPIAHAPNTGPLREVFDAGTLFAETDTTYYECADGRLVFWNHRSHTLETVMKVGVAAKVDPAASPGDGAAPAVGEPAAAPAPNAPAPTKP